ncbi:hypothetical protein [Actinomadura kijaniata]|uniref:hypothetical protein n=1 Tax=Actinomadura kijaniata TaxID=46161 RepID=UPI0012F9B3D8|nr:hypothetical protein [Actinomadura kijaniata]
MRPTKISSLPRTAMTAFATTAVLAAPVLAATTLLTTDADAATRGRVVEVTVGTDGFTAPAAVRPGPVAFRVTAADPEGAYLGLVRLRPGVTLQRYLTDLEKAYGAGDPAAARAVQREVVMFGGAAVQPGTPVTYGTRLAPGSYHLIDFREVGRPGLAAKVRPLTVRPGAGAAAEPRAEARIVQRETPEGPRFDAPAEIRSGATVRVVNRSRQYNEAILMPVRPGTTGEQVGAFYRGMDGGPQAPSPFTGGPAGMVPLSPGRAATFAAPLRPGTYALVTWLRSSDTGRMFAAQGMHRLVTVR